MDNWLDENEFVPFAPDTPGEEVHIHHCKQGKNNDRLYIRREDDGAIVAYCHHCGMRGFHRDGGIRNIHTLGRVSGKKAKDKSGNLKLPSDLETNVTKWPRSARTWPLKYGITQDELRDYHVGYSESYGGVVLPSYNEDGSLCVLTVRTDSGSAKFKSNIKEEGTKEIPKYLTYRDKKMEGLSRLHFAGGSHAAISFGPEQCAVLVEDILSAIKVARVTGNAFALLGTSIDDKGVFTLATEYDKILVWLDNDNPEVRKSQSRLVKRLQLYNRNINIIYTNKDPKEHTTEEIREIINDH